MKIVYCIAKTSASGGMERVLSIKANYLSAHGHEIIIITTDQRNEPSFFELDSRICCYDLGVNYEENNGKSFINKAFYYPIKQRMHKRKLTVLLEELKADIVISMFCNDASFISKIKDGSKKILEIHFSKLKRLQYGRKGIWGICDRLKSKSDEKVVTKFDKFVVLTHEDLRYWGEAPHMEVIPNPSPFNDPAKALLDRKIVVAIGRYEYQKGFDLLIEAWGVVHKHYPEWKLDIIGEGPLKHELQHLINNNGLQASISLKQPIKDIKDVYLRSSMLVMSSRYEGLPMVLIEAQSLGVPAVSFACKCGPRDIITGGVDGILVMNQDIKGLAQGVMKLIKHEVLRKQMGAAAKENSRRFSEGRIMEQWVCLFESLTKT